MILSSFVIDYLFYMLLIFFCFGITSGSARGNQTNASTEIDTNIVNPSSTIPSQESADSTTRISTSAKPKARTTMSTKSTTRTSTSTKSTTTTTMRTTVSATVTTTVITTISAIVTTTVRTTVSATATTKTTATNRSDAGIVIAIATTKTVPTNTNTIITIYKRKSSLPIILGSVFGGLAIIVLTVSVIIYVLIQQGYIKVFNQPRTRAKDLERSRLADSSSLIGGTSTSRR